MRTCTPASARPTVAGSLSSGVLAETTGDVSVMPYPCKTGRPSPRKQRAIGCASAAPPLTAIRKRPPNCACMRRATRGSSNSQARSSSHAGIAPATGSP